MFKISSEVMKKATSNKYSEFIYSDWIGCHESLSC